MSIDDWLARLGLLHLRNKPRELRDALEKAIAKDLDELDAMRAAVEQRLRALKGNQAPKDPSD